MQQGAQAAIIAGGALAAYLMAKLTPPTNIMTTKEDLQNEIVDQDINHVEEKEIKERGIDTVEDNEHDLIELVTRDSLLDQLKISTENSKQKALEIGRFGFPSYDNLRFYDSYCSSINYRTSCPNWSGEFISKNDLNKCEEVDRDKCPDFSASENVPEKFRSELADYKRSGYSRGHLAPAGDHNSIQLHKDLTFQLSSNIVPQEMSMNGCDWLRVERFVKNIIMSNQTDIQRCWIFTGPVFKPTFKINDGKRMYSKPIYVENENNEIEKVIKTYNAPKNANDGRIKGYVNYKTIGNTHVHVPTHLYKVILAERGETDDNDDNNDTNDDIEKYQLCAFMMKNDAIHDKLPLTDYLIDIDELEHWTGLQFFPRLNKYGELCKNYDCKYDDDERSKGWRPLAIIKSCQDLDELETVWKNTQQIGFDKEWMKNYYGRQYYYRKKDLIKPIQKRIHYFRQFQ